jgi:hypothetical protein
MCSYWVPFKNMETLSLMTKPIKYQSPKTAKWVVLDAPTTDSEARRTPQRAFDTESEADAEVTSRVLLRDAQ